jgi:hypothetical protein
MNSARSQCSFAFALMLFLGTTAHPDLPTFVTRDTRLPNPDRPYVMTTGTVQFPPAYDFGLYDLQFQPTNRSQLDMLSRNKDGNWEFESVFDIAYEAHISFGLGPVHGVKGVGTAHMRGEELVAPASIDNDTVFLDTELVALNLVGLSSDPAFGFRESPTLRSSGVTILENACRACASPLLTFRISSYVDVYAEASADGGNTWAAGDKSFRIVQQSEPVVLGDYNYNGVVDAADYVVWRKNLGPGTLANEAGISPGVVDQADYRYWRSRFGATAEFRSALTATVPEPDTVLLCLAASFVALIRRHPSVGFRHSQSGAAS